jgi:hypothetical protein
MAHDFSARCLDGRRAGVGGEACPGGEAGYVAHPADDLRRQDRPDPEQRGQTRGGFSDRIPDARLEIEELSVEAPDVS